MCGTLHVSTVGNRDAIRMYQGATIPRGLTKIRLHGDSDDSPF